MTSECIDSVIEKTHDVNYEIILVDNSSTDGSKEYFERDSRIKYIYSEENLGFGRANNLGAKFSDGKYLFFLNSDTLLIENSLNTLFKFLQNHREYAACGCQLLYADGSYQESHIKYPSLWNDITEIIPSRLYLSRKKNSKYEVRKILDSIESINGADIFIAKNIFIEMSGFDPEYFMYYEETDLFYNIKKAGYKIALIPNTKLIHINGGSFSKISISKYTMMYRSKLLFYKRNYSIVYLFFARLILSISILVRIHIFKYSTSKILSIAWK